MDTQENLNVYKDAYSKQFSFSDENLWFLTHYATLISHIIRKHKSNSVLSLGIGFKVVSEMLMNEFNYFLQSHTILEGSEEIISSYEIPKTYRDKVKVIHTYFEDFESDQEFDVIEMGFVLEHLHDPLFVLKKYRDFLQQGGRIFVAVPNAQSLHRLIGYEAGIMNDMYELSEHDKQLGHKHYFDLQSISDMINEAGYTIISSIGLMLKPVTNAQISQLSWGDNIIKALLTIGERYPEISNCILIEATFEKK